MKRASRRSRLRALGHARADRRAYGNAGQVDVLETVDVDAEVHRCDALAMEWIDPAGAAEVVRRGVGVELVRGQSTVRTQEAERGFMDLDHQRILAPADRAVAGRQLREVRPNLKSDRSAVATAAVGCDWSRTHARAPELDGGPSIGVGTIGARHVALRRVAGQGHRPQSGARDDATGSHLVDRVGQHLRQLGGEDLWAQAEFGRHRRKIIIGRKSGRKIFGQPSADNNSAGRIPNMSGRFEI